MLIEHLGIFTVYLEGSSQIFDAVLMLTHFEVAIRAIFEELNICWLHSYGLIETDYGFLVLLHFVITAAEAILNCWILHDYWLVCCINVILYD